MDDNYTSVECVYYDRLIHINRVRVLWHNDTPQYSLCIKADRYTSIESVYYGRLIHISTVCVL